VKIILKKFLPSSNYFNGIQIGKFEIGHVLGTFRVSGENVDGVEF
jgi:hypothetical protein